MIDYPFIVAVSSQFGFDYYERNVDRLEGKLAIESLYGDFEPEGARGVSYAIKNTAPLKIGRNILFQSSKTGQALFYISK